MASNDPMRAILWNCIKLGGPTTISLLKESIRLYLLDIVFICETKQSKGILGTVCKRLRFGDIWIVQDPIGRKGGILVAWSDKVKVTVVRRTDFCMELKIMIETEKDNFWATFVYASANINERKE